MNKEDVELYRDDDLGIFKNMSRPEIERKKKLSLKSLQNACYQLILTQM